MENTPPFDIIQALTQEIEAFVITDKSSLETFRLAFVSGKSRIAELLAEIKNVPQENRKSYGAAVNTLKDLAQQKFKDFQQKIEDLLAQQQAQPLIDLTLPTIPQALGSTHPLSITKNRIIEIFERIGFNVSESYEIEDDFHNFTALNFPADHPAREMQDTFFINKGANDVLLRTHTSTVQVRLMEAKKPPIRAIMPGRVFRNEAISARAHCIFHQVEGLFIDKNVSFADLKQTLYHFAQEMFGKDTQIRFRPSFFPFTEPSAEIDISCGLHHPQGCALCGGSQNICKGTGWVEIGGAGMVDPNVLESCGIDSTQYTGFAFGMGIERITMLKYQIKDLRLFTENDTRFLQQFKHL